MNTVSDRNEAWRDELRRSVAAKDRVTIERVVMPETSPAERIKSQRIEVNKGLTAEMAVTEARRCMDCVTPTCMEGCPVGIDIPGFVKNIERGDFLQAAAVLKRTSALPSVCGRVCPQEKQCESKCFYIQKLKKKPVAIGYLERFAADYERESGHIALPEQAPANGIKVGIIGSGPSGLSCAGDLAKLGYDVTVFEALHEIGGVLKYGIPEFRLPNRIVDVEIDNLRKMGVKFVTDFVVGMTDTVADLEAAVAGDEGYPYAVPVSFVYKDRKIYIHSALEGHKVDAVKQNSKDAEQYSPDVHPVFRILHGGNDSSNRGNDSNQSIESSR